ncbi:hypothetical protein F5Y13DRAFT_204332 [Hypoxylon sp. FL1857]|nr:hypothetical protein F5Y13DRAFT_204332 [Hypoxylon sp. FL1857]
MSPQAAEQDVNDMTRYTHMHLSAVSTLFPPTPRNVQKLCGPNPSRGTPQGQKRITRVYYAEPSYYDYTCYMIREIRYGIPKQWYPANNEVVVDDAILGSPVAAVGWWLDSANRLDFEGTWETRVYYIDKNKRIRESTNRSDFTVNEGNPKAGNSISPTYGWEQTPLDDDGADAKLDGVMFPIISPLPSSKLAAIRTESGDIYLFYQNVDNRIHTLISTSENGWK